MDDFKTLRFKAGLPDGYCRDFFKVHRTTVDRWDSGEVSPPESVRQCLLMLAGQFPEFAARSAFAGWRFVRDYLYSPSGERFTPEDIDGIRYQQNLEQGQRAKIRQLERKIDTLQAQIDDLTPATPDNVVLFPGVRAI